MKEPYKLVKTIDESKVTSLGAGIDSLVIGAVVNTPSGRTDRVRVANASDFISEYLVNDSVLASDDPTIQHVAKILDKSPMYIIRVDPSNVRLGVSSYGRKLYFDKDFNLISSYRLSELVASTEEPDEASVTITPADVTITPKPSHNQQSPNVNLDTFFTEFMREYPDVILNIDGDTVIIDGTIASGDYTGFNSITSTNLTGTKSNVNLMKYVLGNIEKTLGDSTYITVGAYNFYAGTNVPNNGLINYKIFYPTSLGTPITYKYFNVYLSDAIQSVSGIPNPVVTKQKASLNDLGSYQVIGDVDEFLYNNGGTLTSLNATQIKKPFMILDKALNDNTPITAYIPKVSLSEVSEYIKSAFTDDGITVNSIEDTVETDVYSISVTPAAGVTVSNVTLTVRQLDKFNGASSDTPSEYITPQLFITLLGPAASVGNAIISNETQFYWENDVNPGLADSTNSGIVTSYSAVDPETEVITSITHSNNSNNSELNKNSYWVKVDNIVFYNGEAPTGEDIKITDTLVKLSSSKELTLDEFLTELYSAFTTYFTGAVLTTYDVDANEHINMFIANLSADVTACTDISVTSSGEIIQSADNDKFAIVAAFPSSKDVFKYTYEKNTTDFDADQGVYDIDLYYKDAPNSYQMSFDDTVFDGYGRSLYYENINQGSNKSDYFRVVKLNGNDEFDKFESKSWGSEIQLITPTSANYKEAAAKFMDYEDVYYDIIWDAGHCDASYQKYLTTICGSQTEDNPDYLHALAALSVEPSLRTASKIKSYVDNIGVDTYRGYINAPGYIQDVFGGFGSKFAGSTAYIEKLIDNFNSIASEFDPIYGPTNGLVSTPNLIVNLNKTERESLLDSRINSIFQGKYGYQFNFNKTLQKSKSYLDEEQNVRIANAIAHVADRYAETLIGQYNTAVLRSQVESRLYELIKARVVSNKNKCVDAIKIICNDDNNPQPIIDNQQLVIEVQVAYLRSIAYITVYNKVKKLGSI